MGNRPVERINSFETPNQRPRLPEKTYANEDRTVLVPLVDTRVGKGLSSSQLLSCDFYEKRPAGVNLLFTKRTIYCLGDCHPRIGRDDLSTFSKLLASEVVNLNHSPCWSDRGRHQPVCSWQSPKTL